MDKLSWSHLIGLGVIILQGVLLWIKRDAFFQGGFAEKEKRYDKGSEKVNELVITVTKLDGVCAELVKRVENISKNVGHIDSTTRHLEKDSNLQDLKILHLEKLYDKVIDQADDFQKSLGENSQAINSLKGSMESVRELLEKIVDGRLIIKHD